MNTGLALPEEPEDRCTECRTTLEFHMEHPEGVRYVKLRPMKVEWVTEWNDSPTYMNPTMDIKTCYIYKQGLFG